jgi:hypothetical protein
MKPTNQPIRLQLNHYRSYIAISYDDIEVGFCTPEFADRIVETFNEYERLHEDNETLNKPYKWLAGTWSNNQVATLIMLLGASNNT